MACWALKAPAKEGGSLGALGVLCVMRVLGVIQVLVQQRVGHTVFAIKLYRIQAEAAKYFINEGPRSTSSWKLQEVQELLHDPNTNQTNTDMRRFGMMIEDKIGDGLVKKPTGFLTNSEHVKEQLSKKGTEGHRHVQLMEGKARACQVYPEKLVRAI